jgi:hypothetical protein
MGPVAPGRDAIGLERRFHRLVPRPRRRIVEPVPMHLPRAGLGDHRAQDVKRRAAPHHKARARLAQRHSEGLHPQAKPPFRRRAVALDHLVDDEERDDGTRGRRRAERRVVRQAQVPPDPVKDRCLCHAPARCPRFRFRPVKSARRPVKESARTKASSSFQKSAGGLGAGPQSAARQVRTSTTTRPRTPPFRIAAPSSGRSPSVRAGSSPRACPAARPWPPVPRRAGGSRRAASRCRCPEGSHRAGGTGSPSRADRRRRQAHRRDAAAVFHLPQHAGQHRAAHRVDAARPGLGLQRALDRLGQFFPRHDPRGAEVLEVASCSGRPVTAATS